MWCFQFLILAVISLVTDNNVLKIKNKKLSLSKVRMKMLVAFVTISYWILKSRKLMVKFNYI